MPTATDLSTKPKSTRCYKIVQLSQAEDVPDKALAEAKGAQAGQMLNNILPAIRFRLQPLKPQVRTIGFNHLNHETEIYPNLHQAILRLVPRSNRLAKCPWLQIHQARRQFRSRSGQGNEKPYRPNQSAEYRY
jgi:hypothetical protein